MKSSSTRVRKEHARTVATKARILCVAQMLFATRGFANVNMVEIGLAAKQKNRSVAQYHFKTKDNILNEVLKQHLMTIDFYRNRALDQLESKSHLSHRDIAKAIVLPLVEHIETDAGGVYYLHIMAQMLSSNEFPLLHKEDLRSHFASKRLYAFSKKVQPGLHKKLYFSRVSFVLSIIFHGMTDFLAKINVENDEKFRLESDNKKMSLMKIFVSDLVDCVELLLSQPPSKETDRLLRFSTK